MRVDPALNELEREAFRIVELICSERVPDDEIDRRIARLRDRTRSTVPDDPHLFEKMYAPRFQRLRARFRPAPGLF